MKDKRVVVFFAAGFLIAAALGGIYFLIEDNKPRSGDDDRVVVAGGSLVIGSQFGFKRDTATVAIHKHKKRKVTGGDIIIDGVPLLPGSWPVGPIQFEIAYCAGNCNPDKPDDKITILTDSDATHLRASNTNSAHGLGDEAATAPDPKKIIHEPKEGKVKQIKDVLNNHTYPCTNGLCSVLPTYHCDVIGDCQ